jgi:hypothetical protein
MIGLAGGAAADVAFHEKLNVREVKWKNSGT